jgi:RNase adaptor protein for sRNA GlmZ degradation
VHSQLATNAETTDQSAIALDIATLHVIEQTATLANELHQSTTGVVITLVYLEVLGEV